MPHPVDAGVWATLALAVSLRSGYSVGGIVLLAAGLWHGPSLLRREIALTRPWALWAVAILAMSLVWTMHIVEGGQFITSTLGLDRVTKYWLVLLLLPALMARAPSVGAMFWGCVVGAVGAGLTALWQTALLDLPRAQGYTNAIQFGNLGLLLGLWCAIWALHVRPAWWRLAAGLGAAMGLFASVASGTRGGWVVLPPCLLLILILARRPQGSLAARAVRALGLTLALCLPLAFLPPVQERVQEAAAQVSDAFKASEGTPIGMRFAEWEFAWELGLRAPWVGSGQEVYEAQQRQAVAEGRFPAHMIRLNHAHNEWLDMFAKRGVVGVLGLLFFFGLPLTLFWRFLRRGGPEAEASVPDPHRAAALCGLVTVVAFVGFGTTQVMFAHNNGNLMYLLAVSVWLAGSGMGASDDPGRNERRR